MQEDYFKIVTKEEARVIAMGKGVLFILHDDNSESEIENIDEINNTQERIGIELSREEVVSKLRDRIEEWHEAIRGVIACQEDIDTAINQNYNCQADLFKILEQMKYIASIS